MMDQIDKAYQAGLRILQPSKRDTYGFGPQAAPRADGLKALVKALWDTREP